MKKPLHITIPITKIDEDQRMVYGYATVEELDSHGEIITYDASKKAFSSWIGNIREMHQEKAVGKALDVEFDDEAKGVWLGAKISESDDGEQAWIKIKEGVYAGFSIGGAVNDSEVRTMMIDGKKKGVRVITDYDLGETSIVDNPAVASAVFQMVKSRDGKLYHEEKFSQSAGRPVHWWESMYKFSDSQKVMKGSILTYNENSMADNRSKLVKSLWEADMLLDLAQCLSNYIMWEEMEGEDMTDLKAALETIKAAVVDEITEPDDSSDDLGLAIENAAKALNIKKKEELTKMADKIKQVNKSVVGSEDRDAEGKVVSTAEENGRPADDTEERAAAAAENVAEKPKAGKEAATEDVEEPETPAAGDQEEEDAAAEGEESAAEEDAEDKSGDGEGKKSAKAEFTKSTDTEDLTKSILSGVEKLIEKSVAPLKEKVEKLEKQAAPSKVRSAVAVKKGDEVESEDNSAESKLRKEFDSLIKRSEELERNPSSGTHEERLQIAFQLRKLSRQLDPASVAKHAAVRATFAKG